MLKYLKQNKDNLWDPRGNLSLSLMHVLIIGLFNLLLGCFNTDIGRLRRYSAKQWVKIGKYVDFHGATEAAHYFSRKLKHSMLFTMFTTKIIYNICWSIFFVALVHPLKFIHVKNKHRKCSHNLIWGSYGMFLPCITIIIIQGIVYVVQN